MAVLTSTPVGSSTKPRSQQPDVATTLAAASPASASTEDHVSEPKPISGHKTDVPTNSTGRKVASGLGFERYFTIIDKLEKSEKVIWEKRDARLVDYRDGSVAFEQTESGSTKKVVTECHQHFGSKIFQGNTQHTSA